MNRTNVLEIFSLEDAHQIARWYDSSPALGWTPAFQRTIHEYVEASYKAATTQFGVKFVSGQPYENADEMRAYLAKHNGLLISTDFNTTDADIMPGRINLMFRFMHDIDHCMTGDCNFNFNGEVCAYSKAAARTKNPAIRQWLFTEIVGQVASLGLNKEYPPQKFLLAPQEWVSHIAHSYGY